MVEKTIGKCFGCYLYVNNVWDGNFANHVVWAGKSAVFSHYNLFYNLNYYNPIPSALGFFGRWIA